MKDKTEIIQTWWVNRASIYWVPLLIISLGVNNILKNVHLTDAYELIAFGFVIILAFEYRIFGFRIVLSETLLIYRDRGFPWRREIVLSRENILRTRDVYFDKGKKFRSAHVAVFVLEGNSETVKYITVASFRPRDIKRIVEWLNGETAN